jgi:uncharacterized SAM-binding protein YcdF (DUF218 family)
LIGIVALWLLDKRRVGNALIIGGIVLLVLFSTFLFPNFLINSLEEQYPSLTDSELIRNYSDVHYIVVLGGGIAYSEKLPITSQFYPTSLVRIAEGMRLFLKLNNKSNDVKLVVSGGGNYPVTSAELMAELSEQFGIRKESIIVEKDSYNTYDEAVNVTPIVKGERFLLVTSAVHMPRSMALFRHAGLRPIAAPTDHRTDENDGHAWILPSADNLVKTELAFYEYLGLIKEKLAAMYRVNAS